MSQYSTARVNIPASSSTVSVSIVDTASRLSFIPLGVFAGPPLAGFETFSAAAYAFLITHEDPATGTQKRLLFDLGPPKQWQEALAPSNVGPIQGWVQNGAKLDIPKDVSEILTENNVQLGNNDALIWSHPHWDHIGRPSQFSTDVPLIVGPGVKGAFGPGYPSNEAAPFLEIEMKGRTVTELTFDTNSATIGGLQTIDYFGDGSFYILNAPGHCIGHVNALARVSSNPDTFILMGADSFHHASQIRPSSEVPIPDSVEFEGLSSTTLPTPCPGEVFSSLYPDPEAYKTSVYAGFCSSCVPRKTPFFTISQQEDGSTVSVDLKAARDVISKLQAFDGDDRVLVVAAHDSTLLEVLDFFPKKADDWMAGGWKEKGRWRFLGDLDKAVEKQKAGARR